MNQACVLNNAGAVPLDAVPVHDLAGLRQWLDTEVRSGGRVSVLAGLPLEDGRFRLYALLARDSEHSLAVAAGDIEGRKYPALTPGLPELHLFERELHERFDLLPDGHPWLKPVRFEQPDGPEAGIADFYQVGGEDVHEVAVGPIHAGVIEAGHFRFQCQGELVMHLEISLGYHHRGVENILQAGPDRRSLPLMEVAAGDSTAAHAWAYCAALEALAGLVPSLRAQHIRDAALELERLANHTGDLGALAGDVGFLPTSAFCGRLRGDYLNMSAMLCGSRFGRGLLTPGGVRFDVDAKICAELLKSLKSTARDTHGAIRLLLDSTSVQARMVGIGALSRQAADDLGLVGPAARASGLARDCRRQHPMPGLHSRDVVIHTSARGDVASRTKIRYLELAESIQMVERLLANLPEGEINVGPEPGSIKLAPNMLAASLVEGWRGEVCHLAITNGQGGFACYKVVDPSFHNWMGLALAMRDQQISDFPLCNKSFNLSYCGHDL